VPVASAGGSHGAVVLVAPASWIGRVAPASPFQREFLRTLQVQCSLGGLRPLKACYSVGRGESVRITTEEGRPFDPAMLNVRILGAIVWTAGDEDRCREAVGSMRPWQCPVAVLDETGTIPDRAAVPARFYPVAWTPSPSMLLGRYLRESGHRRAAFISPFYGALWSKNRFAGLCDGIGDGAVVPCTDSRYIHLQDLYRALKGWQRRDESDFLRTGSVNRYEPSRRHLRSYKERELDLGMAEALEAHVVPLLDKALTTGATVWVADSDRCAVIALDYCASRGIRVPRDLSVAGFDNTVDAAVNDLTSVDFNVQAYAGTMLAFLLRRETAPAGQENSGEIASFVIERGSTAAIRTRAVASDEGARNRKKRSVS